MKVRGISLHQIGFHLSDKPKNDNDSALNSKQQYLLHWRSNVLLASGENKYSSHAQRKSLGDCYPDCRHGKSSLFAGESVFAVYDLNSRCCLYYSFISAQAH